MSKMNQWTQNCNSPENSNDLRRKLTSNKPTWEHYISPYSKLRKEHSTLIKEHSKLLQGCPGITREHLTLLREHSTLLQDCPGIPRDLKRRR